MIIKAIGGDVFIDQLEVVSVYVIEGEEKDVRLVFTFKNSENINVWIRKTEHEELLNTIQTSKAKAFISQGGRSC